MRTYSTGLKFLFLFLTTTLLTNCSSTDLEDEAGIELQNENENFNEIDSEKIYLIDKEKSERPGNQGG